MAFSFAHGAVQWQAADAATTTYSVTTTDVRTGLDFQPKALMFYCMGLGSSTDTASETTHWRGSVGFATSTSSRRCVTVQDQDAAPTTVCTAGLHEAAVLATVTSTPAFDGLLDLNSITSTGFQLIVDDATPVNISVFWLAWGGSDITVATDQTITEPAATGTADYTVTGFASADTDDQVVIFAGCQSTSAAGTAARFDAGLCLGFASGGAAGENAVICGNQDDASNATDTDSYALDSECLGMITVAGGVPSARAQLTQFNTNGFRLNWIARATTSRKYIALAMKGGMWRAGSTTLNMTVTSSTATVSSLPFKPDGLLLMSHFSPENAAGASGTNILMSVGTGNSPTSRRAMALRDENATASSNCEVDLAIEYDQVLITVSAAGAAEGAVDINAINSDGFQLICDSTDGNSASWMGYLTFGMPVSFPHPRRDRRIVPLI